jgi:hypothetical protein
LTIALIERTWPSAAGAKVFQANRLVNDLLMEPSRRSILSPVGAPGRCKASLGAQLLLQHPHDVFRVPETMEEGSHPCSVG